MTEYVKIFDTTLRDGEQSPGVEMNTKEKVQIAVQLEKLGVDIIEAGFPAAYRGDIGAVLEIAKRLNRAEIAVLAQANKSDIDIAWDAIQYAVKPRIHIFIPTSDIQLDYKLNMSREKVINATVEAVKYAKSFTEIVEFTADDGSRSDRDYLCKVFGAAIQAGATTINLPDTVGYAIPEEFAERVKYVKEHTPNIHQATFSVHCHNDLGLATANTIAAISAGARQAEVTINGIGARAGNAPMEEVVMALYTRQSHMPFNTGIKTQHIFSTSRLVSMITGIMVQPNKAIVGNNAFAHKAGIHQNEMPENSTAYELMKPETIGLSRNQLPQYKHSGRYALGALLKKLGYDLSKEELETILKQCETQTERFTFSRRRLIGNDHGWVPSIVVWRGSPNTVNSRKQLNFPLLGKTFRLGGREGAIAGLRARN
jgi:2-isopropylmalate synthase